jgi:hypothetical protein
MRPSKETASTVSGPGPSSRHWLQATDHRRWPTQSDQPTVGRKIFCSCLIGAAMVRHMCTRRAVATTRAVRRAAPGTPWGARRWYARENLRPYLCCDDLMWSSEGIVSGCFCSSQFSCQRLTASPTLDSRQPHFAITHRHPHNCRSVLPATYPLEQRSHAAPEQRHSDENAPQPKAKEQKEDHAGTSSIIPRR